MKGDSKWKLSIRNYAATPQSSVVQMKFQKRPENERKIKSLLKIMIKRRLPINIGSREMMDETVVI